MKSMAVIPARAGSTRLKDKNMYPLKGIPLIRWITKAVLDSQCFSKVLVSTDSDEIFEKVSDLEVTRHERPAELATTQSTVLDAMMDIMDKCDEKYDVFSYFLPTCPFVSSEDIQEGYKLLSSADTVVSMTEFSDTVQLACLLSGDSVIPVFDNLEKGITNSKYLKKFYKPSGAFYMGQWSHLQEHRNFFIGSVKAVRIPKERSVDINDIHDIVIAESVLSLRE